MSLQEKPKLGCDVDGVVIDFIGYLLPFANRLLGTRVTYDQLFSFHPAECFGVTEDEFKAVHDQFHREVYRHDDTPRFEEAFLALSRLQSKFELHFLTAAQDHLVDIRTAYLQRHFPGCEVHFTQGFSTILGEMPGRVTKFRKAVELGLLAMIDDNPHEIEEWDPSQVPLIVHPQPWNARTPEVHQHIPRLDWPGTEAYLAALVTASV